MRTRHKLAIVGACFIGAAAVDGSTAQGLVDPFPNTRDSAEIETALVVLPVIADCDSESMVKLARDLIESGWRADGVADNFGEALADPTESVVIRWEC